MKRIVPSMLLLAVLSGCSLPAPYVHQAREFDRSSASFGKDPTDITGVTICYARRNAQPQTIVELARQECGRFGKIAAFEEQSYNVCPLSTPVAAVYSCIDPGLAAGQTGF